MPGLDPSLKQTQDTLFAKARGFREGGAEVSPVAFLVGPEGLSILSLARAPKEDWRGGILEVMRVTRAFAVILHSEGYMALGEDAMLAAHLKLQGVETIQGLPGVEEYVYSTLETKDGYSRVLRAHIGQDGALGETVVEESDPSVKVEGHLAGFFD